MKIQTCVSLLTGLLLAVLLSPAVADKQELPPINEDGLHLLEESNAAIVYVDPAASLTPYNKVMLLDSYVAFKKNWARDQRRTSIDRRGPTAREIEEIKQNLATEFRKVFVEQLTENGYEVVTEPADDVLLVRPAIINLDVNAPDTQQAGRSRTYVESAGEMTLYVELYDSVTGDIIAKAMDAQADRGFGGYYTWANSVTNRAAADRILKGWAQLLVGALDQARNPGS